MTQSENMSRGNGKKVLSFADEAKGTSKSKSLSANEEEMVAGYFDIEEALTQLKSSLKKATDFVQRRPVMVFVAACAVGLIGTLAFTAKKRIS